jgi:hypothetical protein
MIETIGSSFNSAFIIPIIVVLIVAIYVHSENDLNNANSISTVLCHKELPAPSIPQKERLRVEFIIDQYNKKMEKNTYNCYNIRDDICKGATRGALGAVIMGGNVCGMFASAVCYGAISGLSAVYDLHHTGNTINPLKP